jgi:hypothetical protein
MLAWLLRVEKPELRVLVMVALSTNYCVWVKLDNSGPLVDILQSLEPFEEDRDRALYIGLGIQG